jgi:putative acetyltransferase
MDSAFTIRPPASSDEWMIVRQLLIDYRNEFDDETCFTSFEDELNDLEGVYADPGKWKLIAVEEPSQKIVGCVAARTLSPGVAEMKRLYVIPSHRGYHLGRRLAEEIITLTQQDQYTRMVLDTMLEMKDAQRLYERLGFRVVGPYDNQDLSKLICYEKELT